MKRLTNRTDDQIRAEAQRNYEKYPTQALESVVRMNAGTQIVEKEITRQVAQELLSKRTP